MYLDRYQTVHYRVSLTSHKVFFEEYDQASGVYNNSESGFIRKAKIPDGKKPYVGTEGYNDLSFQPPSEYGIKFVRLYDMFDQDEDHLPLFPPNESRSSFINQMENYPSFLAQSGVISYKYLRTLFITQQISSNGYYQYFIKRNGQYYVQECDDYIPIDAKTNKPLYGLSLKHPWQIMLMKAWLKQMRNWHNFHNAEPFRFLDAFGLPEYKTFYFKKELDFLKKERVTMQRREQNIEGFTLNRDNVIIIAQTKDNPKLRDIGLIPNTAAYKMVKISEEGCYRIHSSLPCKWVGQLTPIENTKINKMKINDHHINLQRTFLMTEQEAINYFGKCYVVPDEVTQIQSFKTQNTLNLRAQKDQSMWIKFDCNDRNQGLLAMSIEMERSDNLSQIYPQVKYFLCKQNNQQDIQKSHLRNDIRESKMKQNQYVESNCDKWTLYRIDYQRGYHHSSAFFTKLQAGKYCLFLQFNKSTPFTLRFDSAVKITQPEVVLVSPIEQKTMFDSTFFQVSQSMGIETSFQKKSYDESIFISNSFDEVGFGAISIATLVKAKHDVGLRVFPKKLRAGGYDLCEHFYKATQRDSAVEDDDKGYVLVSRKGKPEIIVIRRIDESKRTTLEEQFPPQDSVEFFKITPLSQVNKSKSGKSGVRGSSRSRPKSKLKRSNVN